MNRQVGLLAVVVVLAVIGCSPLEPERVVTGSSPRSSPTGSPATPPPTFRVGDVVRMGDLEHKLWGARFSDGAQYFKPEPGTRWLVLDIEVTNTGAKPTSISSLLMWKLQDEEHRSADLQLMADVRGHLDGEIGATRSIRGELAFTVGQAQKQWELLFAPGVFQRGQAIYVVTADDAKTSR